MIPSGMVFWGTATQHVNQKVEHTGPTIVVVTDFFTVDDALITRLRDHMPTAELWVTEESLSQCGDEDIQWPTAPLAAASEYLKDLEQVALWYGTRLRDRGICGVFGAENGTLSDVSLPWLGDGVRCVALAGLRQAALGAAWVTREDAAGTHWWLDGGGPVVPWQGELFDAPWHWVDVAKYVPHHPETAVAPTAPDRQAVAAIVDHMRRSSIHLVDDPEHLPVHPHTRFVVTCEDLSLKQRASQILNPQLYNDGPVVEVGIDTLPPLVPNHTGLVVANKNLAVIGLAPRQTIKVQIFDDHPTVWTALRRRLLGDEGWFGRSPFRLDQDQLSTHSAHFATEQPHPAARLRWLDRQPLPDLMSAWITAEQEALEQIRPAIPSLERVVRRMVEAYRAGARIFYVGAGSAGRAGMMDAVELPPTFGINPDRVQAILAGGMAAFEKAQEGVEDQADTGRERMMAAGVQAQDVVIGITAHGNTPFVSGALTAARQQGCFTVALVNNRGTAVGAIADEVVFVDSGPEILLGSTRLKAGTVEKVILNLLSTLTLVKMGRSYDNLMIDFVATNEKLRDRAVRVFMIATGVPRTVARLKLEEADGHLAVAMLMYWGTLSAVDAQTALMREGTVAAVLDRWQVKEEWSHGARA